MEHITQTIQFIMDHQAIIAAVCVAALSELMALCPRFQSNGLLHLSLIVLRKVAGKGAVALCLLLLASGCTTLNVSMNTTAGDNNKPAVKTDADATQNVSPTTTATIPMR